MSVRETLYVKYDAKCLYESIANAEVAHDLV